MLPQRHTRKLRESCENLAHEVATTYSRKVSRVYNITTKRYMKTSPQHYGNIHRQRRSVMIFTMLWQPYCNMGKSA